MKHLLSLFALGCLTAAAAAPVKTLPAIESTGLDTERTASAPARQCAPSSGVVTAPEGKAKDYCVTSYYHYYANGFVSYTLQKETACTVVFDDANGLVYLSRPFGGIDTGSFLVGERQGNEVTFTFPQAMIREEEGDDTITQYAMRFESYDDEYGGKSYRVSENQTMVFTIDDTGYMESEDAGECIYDYPQFVLGLTEPVYDIENDEIEWAAFGDANYVLYPFEGVSYEAPDNAEWQEWALEHHYYEEGRGISHPERYLVNVAFGNETINGENQDVVYIQGIYKAMPEATVKGKVNGDKITIPTGQYLGRRGKQYIYFQATDLQEDYDPATNLYDRHMGDMEKYITFTYDRERRRITNAERTVVINACSRQWWYITYIISPKLQCIDRTLPPAAPAKPSINYYMKYDEAGLCRAEFSYDLPDYDVNGNPLDTSRMYYEVYYNGFLQEFGHSSYEEDVLWSNDMQPISKIPYDFQTGFTFWEQNGTHYLCIYEPGIDEIGIILHYEGADGKVLSSEMGKDSDIPGSYNDPTTDPEPDEINWSANSGTVQLESGRREAREIGRYTIEGVPVGKDYRGLQIILMDDGTSKKALNLK